MTKRKSWILSPNPSPVKIQAHWGDPEVTSVDRKELAGGIEGTGVLCFCCLEWMISIINLSIALAQRESDAPGELSD